MRQRCGEAGFTLIEMIVVTAIVALVAGTLGSFFLAGASPAVASAGRDVTAAFDEARRTAIAFDAATVVFAPAASGTGYSARIYARVPGDPAFVPRNGPPYESTVTISEVAAPLGAPGFAFAVDSHGNVTGYAHFVAGATSFNAQPCPAGGAFLLHLVYASDVRDVTIPCQLAPSAASPVTFETPAPAFTATPFPSQTCPAGTACSLAPVLAAMPPSPPPSPLPSSVSTPVALPTAPIPTSVPIPPAANPTPCPTGFSGFAPACAAQLIEQYSAAADTFSAHTSSLFADGSICDDGGCGASGPIDWNWACPFAGRSGSNGNDGSNLPYQPDTPFYGSVQSSIAAADHDAAEGNGDGIVATEDSYCIGFPTP